MQSDEGAITKPRSHPVSLALDHVRLVVVDGPDRGKSADVPHGKARVGCAPGCHLVLSDPTVSRIHCEIGVSRQGIRLRDLQSTNGTYVDGVRIYDAELTDGSTLRIGDTVLRTLVARGRDVVPLAPLDRFGAIIGSSPEMRAIYAMIPRIAQSQTTTLIYGETGTGKELVARAIHDMSPRASAPFVVLDCAGLAPGVIESDLFGHVHGAFTGAIADRPGLFEAAHQGSIFIDEIADLPLLLQPRLLRVLETRQVRRLGANASLAVDVMVIAASSSPLSTHVNAGQFREDLFYRLAVAEIELPPLRARGNDAAEIARHFWERFAGPMQPMPDDILGAVRARSWPGNVRELRNFIERATKLGVASSAGALHKSVSTSVPVDLPLKEARRVWIEQFELLYANAMLDRTRGNVTRAAELAGVNRRSFQRMLAKK
ncbi:MAG TPA: sigma 54-interacting transcriptional regulator [Polyangiaceae bacterium]|nr:sigma 54-interacting transcriptional regulator [Polyangiaceae bacterium]